jgi:hypothetical protein
VHGTPARSNRRPQGMERASFSGFRGPSVLMMLASGRRWAPIYHASEYVSGTTYAAPTKRE